ncbi:hypothetical protein D9M70_581620 [compost metagenome]
MFSSGSRSNGRLSSLIEGSIHSVRVRLRDRCAARRAMPSAGIRFAFVRSMGSPAGVWVTVGFSASA